MTRDILVNPPPPVSFGDTVMSLLECHVLFGWSLLSYSNLIDFVLISEFVLDSTMANAAGLQYLGGPVVTVLSSKTSQRYRLQSDNLPSLWIILQSLEKRLQKRFSRNKQVSHPTIFNLIVLKHL